MSRTGFSPEKVKGRDSPPSSKSYVVASSCQKYFTDAVKTESSLRGPITLHHV
jgi:hypothetical protein